MARKRKTRKPTAKRMTGVWCLTLALFIGELFFYTWCRVQCTQAGVAISAERGKQEELTTLQSSLKIELARLKAPERISYIARQRLGLGMPDPGKTILVP